MSHTCISRSTYTCQVKTFNGVTLSPVLILFVIRLFKYPDMDNQVAYKNFFQADKVDFLWNSKGTSALLLTSTEVDKTGGSYYGKQTLHYISVTGETAMIPLGKFNTEFKHKFK